MRNNKRSQGRSRRSVITLFVGAAATVALASAAWACTAQPVIGPPGSSGAGSGLNPSYGPAGTAVTIDGRAFQTGPVEIRWNSVDGPSIVDQANAPEGPNFSGVQLRIPGTATAAVYSVVAFQRDGLGNVSSMARAPFEVTESGAAPSVSGASSGSGSGAVDSQTTGGATSASLQGGDGGQESTSRPQGTQAANPTGPAVGQGAAKSNGQQTQSNPASVGAGAPGATGAGSSAAVAGVAAGPALRPSISPRSALADLWSGFNKGRSAPQLELTQPADSLPNTLVLGTALLGFALLAAGGGFVVAATTRRRRATMTSR